MVFLALLVLGLLLAGLVGFKNFGKANKSALEKFFDFLFGIDIFLAAWFCASFSLALIAGLGAFLVVIFFPPAAVLVAGAALFLKRARKYKYIVIGSMAGGLAATIVFIDGIRSWTSDIIRFLFQ